MKGSKTSTKVSKLLFRSVVYGLAALLFLAVYSVYCSFKTMHKSVRPALVQADSLFAPPQAVGPVADRDIDEASGLAPSLSHPAALWTHNDSGDKSRIFLIDHQGRDMGTFSIAGAANRDWEDMASAYVQGRPYLFIADIGDNDAQHDVKYVYRVAEPSPERTGPKVRSQLQVDQVIRLQFPDGNRDAETLLVDPLTLDLYLITKREPQVRVYMAPYPQSPDSVITLQLVRTLPLDWIVGGDIAPNGREVLLKNYENVYYWQRAEGESLAQLFGRLPLRLPYREEPQGEAIAWAKDANGYFTLSEAKGDEPSTLYFYRRKQ